MECPICYEPSPKCVLDCNHTLCRSCASSILDHDPHSKLKCPLCRHLSYNILDKTIRRRIFKIELERDPVLEALQAYYYARYGLCITIVIIQRIIITFLFEDTPNPHDRVSYKTFRNSIIRNMNVISTSYSS